MTSQELISTLSNMFPDAKCDLDYQDPFTLLVAVILSAQTTDKSVNLVTPELFGRYPDAWALAKADSSDVEDILKSLGLYKNKSRNIILMAQQLVDKHQGVVPRDHKLLMDLPGVGNKTANVLLAEAFKIPAIGVDTHVERVSKRLGIAKEDDSVLQVQHQLEAYIPQDQWIKSHHLLIYFGRYFCKATKPNCRECPLINDCQYNNKRI